MTVEPCTHCGRDTSFRNTVDFLWVNRIPSEDSYICVQCQLIECEICFQDCFEFEFTGPDSDVLTCQDCFEKLIESSKA